MKSERAVLVVIAGSVLAASALVAADSAESATRSQRREQFQRLLGGLGLGNHTDLSRCPTLFDVRVAGGEHAALGRSTDDPAGCPWHAMSIFPLPDFDADQPMTGAE
jgi:hypothetical protein